MLEVALRVAVEAMLIALIAGAFFAPPWIALRARRRRLRLVGQPPRDGLVIVAQLLVGVIFLGALLHAIHVAPERRVQVAAAAPSPPAPHWPPRIGGW